jgi:hypothetical protein
MALFETATDKPCPPAVAEWIAPGMSRFRGWVGDDESPMRVGSGLATPDHPCWGQEDRGCLSRLRAIQVAIDETAGRYSKRYSDVSCTTGTEHRVQVVPIESNQLPLLRDRNLASFLERDRHPSARQVERRNIAYALALTIRRANWNRGYHWQVRSAWHCPRPISLVVRRSIALPFEVADGAVAVSARGRRYRDHSVLTGVSQGGRA